jgi:hypothetical protein
MSSAFVATPELCQTPEQAKLLLAALEKQRIITPTVMPALPKTKAEAHALLYNDHDLSLLISADSAFLYEFIVRILAAVLLLLLTVGCVVSGHGRVVGF